MEETPASVRRSFQETSRRCRFTRRESPAAAVSVREVSLEAELSESRELRLEGCDGDAYCGHLFQADGCQRFR